MLAILTSAALAVAGTPVQSEALPTGEWASRMIMSFTMDGDLSGCRLENSGALPQPAGVFLTNGLRAAPGCGAAAA